MQKKLISLLLVLTMLLSVFSMALTASAAYGDVTLFEGETATCAVSDGVSQGTNSYYYNSDAPSGGLYAQFGNVTVGSVITYTLNVKTAGYYELNMAYREHSSGATVQVAVNGTNVGDPVRQNTADSSKIVSKAVGGANLVAGDNTVTLTVTALARESDNRVTVDCITLTESANITESDIYTYKTLENLTWVSGEVDGVAVDAAPETASNFAGGYYTVASPGARAYTSAAYTYSFEAAADGVYILDYNYRWHETGRLWEIRIDGVAVGSVDTSVIYEGTAKFGTKPVTDTGLPAGKYGTVALTEGTHQITFACVGAGSNGTNSSQRFTIGYVQFSRIGDLPTYPDSVYDAPVIAQIAEADLDLPATVYDSANEMDLDVAWTSSDEAVIAADGTVTEAAATKLVVLTAKIDTPNGEETLEYSVFVPGSEDAKTVAINTVFNVTDAYTGEAVIITNSTGDTAQNHNADGGWADVPDEAYSPAPYGNRAFARVNASAVGAAVTVPVNVAAAGTYDLQYTYREHNHCGKVQVSVNGTAVGAVADLGAADTNCAKLAEVGEVTLNQGLNLITFTVTEKGTKNGYGMDLFDIFLSDSALADAAEKVGLTVTASDGVVNANEAGSYNITWNAGVTWNTETDLAEINELVTFKEYGVVYGVDEDSVLAAAEAGADTGSAKIKAFDSGEDINVYTIFGFRLKNVAADKARAAMFYITYEVGGQTYTVYSACESGSTAAAE